MDGKPETRFKLFHYRDAVPLSDIIPILENLGARTVEEHPYELRMDGRQIWIHDFVLKIFDDPDQSATHLQKNFEEAFVEIWFDRKENDSFNRLVTAANMDHRKIWILRTYARYFGQLQNGFGQTFIANCLTRYSNITAQMCELFELRCSPHVNRATAPALAAKLCADIFEKIDAVENLNDDRILRRYVEMILATRRTNYYQTDARGGFKDYIAIKFQPDLITEMPLPKPAHEIFVYSRRFEGVHLRGGKIARGGLRWSDRTEDYRVEVLGLMKAQQVKNSVIVPVGAKGGFLPKKIPPGATQEEARAEAIICYRTFIQGLLDVTDNLIKGKVVPPVEVVCHDDADYYLVVAADKGTATFSDIANEIAIANRFWLGDAFASGGSVGYDHKAMAITAKGAWQSVQQHFRNIGHNIQEQDFTVVGVGDMSGDVFGNGMLLTEHIKLVAAFNHLHIFIDPDPDPRQSFGERQRLFDLPRSSWADYNRELISNGGGVFRRDAKAIDLSPQAQRQLNTKVKRMTPTALISLILRAKVDLLWNGGIGTYVKSRMESNQDVGDKANDGIRINGNELRCRFVGEGGNLGMTQLGRIEFNLAGGVCFTDSIDNAGGVNCSDTEVNIKILLNQLVEKGKLRGGARKRLLADMTDAVSDLVLRSNYQQAQAINLMYEQAVRRHYEYSRVMRQLIADGHLNPSLEYMPTEDELSERLTRNQSFTAPELAVLTSYVKGVLKGELEDCSKTEPYLQNEMARAFPDRLVRKYGKELAEHRLRPQIIATQIANNLVNNMGISFLSRIGETTGATAGDIALAYLGARDIFDLEARFAEIRSLDYRVKPQVQTGMMLDITRLVRRGTRWLVRHRREALDLVTEVPKFRSALLSVLADWDEIVGESVKAECLARRKTLESAGASSTLAEMVAAAHYLYPLLPLVDAARGEKQSFDRVARVFFALSDRLDLNWFSRQIHDYQAVSQWEALARESLQEDLLNQQIGITRRVLRAQDAKTGIQDTIDRWQQQNSSLINRWLAMRSEIRSSTVRDVSIFTVGIRELADLSGAG